MKSTHSSDGSLRDPTATDDTTHTHAKQNQPILAMGEDVSCATFNCNGMLTKIQDGNKTIPRLHTILKFFKSTHTHVFALQEPHLRGDKPAPDIARELTQVREMAECGGYEFLTR